VIEAERSSPVRVRVSATFFSEACKGWTAATIWRLLDDDVAMTRCGTMRRARVLGLRRCLLPNAGEGGSWRSSGRAELQVLDIGIVLQWIGRGEVVRGMHQSKIERIGGGGEALAHHGQLISLVMPADMRRSIKEFCRPRCVSGDEEKGRE
jgi:hypothetical protein